MGQGATSTVLVRRWTRREYERMVEAGVFPQARYGWSYRSALHVAPGDHISPLTAPQARVAVADLLAWFFRRAAEVDAGDSCATD